MSTPIKHQLEDDVEDGLEKKKRRVMPKSSVDKQLQNLEKTDLKALGKVLFNAEENEVLQRDAEHDADIHKDVVGELQYVMSRIIEVKKSESLSEEQKQEEIDFLKREGVLQFVSLKKLNRMGHFRCKKIREVTQEAKQKIDQQHLSLQNLLYEVMHLQREISKCLQFKSRDEGISLISMDEFLHSAPKEITEPLLKENDLHKMTLARLDWELKERKALAAKYKLSLGKKESVQKVIEKMKTNLKSLNPLLSSILDSTKPVQDHLKMPFDEDLKQQKIASHLPDPLYFLFVQASSYSKACDKEVSAEIVGDVDVAHSVEKVESPKDDDSDSEDENEKKNLQHRRNTVDSKLTKKQEMLLRKHPLSVVIKVAPKGKGSVTLNFQYLVGLDLVVVSAEVFPGSYKLTPEETKGLFDPLSFLAYLFGEDDDDGEETPNPENIFKLVKYGITDLASHLKDIGRPYHWVQRLCGLQRMTSSRINDVKSQEGQVQKKMSNIEEMVRLLKKRLADRLDLSKQLGILDGIKDKQHSSNLLTGYNFKTVPKKISSHLVKWGRSSYEEFLASPHTRNIRECQLASEKDLYYSGILERTTNQSSEEVGDHGKEEEGRATMDFFVVVSPDYPSSLPLFCVKVTWKDVERSAMNDGAIRELEESVNIRCSGDLSQKELLLNQVAVLASCFDIYLETGGLNSNVVNGNGNNSHSINVFEGEKSFLRLSKGPMRSKPYKFISKLGFFTHF